MLLNVQTMMEEVGCCVEDEQKGSYKVTRDRRHTIATHDHSPYAPTVHQSPPPLRPPQSIRRFLEDGAYSEAYEGVTYEVHAAGAHFALMRAVNLLSHPTLPAPNASAQARDHLHQLLGLA